MLYLGVQGEHLVEGLLMGDEASSDQVATGLIQGKSIHGKTRHGGGIGVVAQPLRIGHGDQKQVKGRRRMGARFEVAVTDQTVIHPAELAGDLSNALWTDGVLLDHSFLL